MPLTRERQEAMRVALEKAGFSAEDIEMFGEKPKRQYSSRALFHIKVQEILQESGIITRSHIKNIEGCPENRQGIKRALDKAQDALNVILVKKDRDTWVIEKDIAPIFDEIMATARKNGQVNIKHFMQKYNLSEDIIHEGLMDRGMHRGERYRYMEVGA